MLLNSGDILHAVQNGVIGLEPFDENRLKPASYVVQLARRWRVWGQGDAPLDPYDAEQVDTILSDVVDQECFVLESHGFCLAATLERIRLPDDMAAIISPISQMARYGLSINLGSMLISPGFGAQSPTALTLELASHCPRPLLLRSGTPVAHLMFTRVSDGPSLSTRGQSVFEGREAPSAPALLAEWPIHRDDV